MRIDSSNMYLKRFRELKRKVPEGYQNTAGSLDEKGAARMEFTMPRGCWFNPRGGSRNGRNSPQSEQTGSISVSSEPSGASVPLDDHYMSDTTSATLMAITPGSHAMGARMEGYDDAKTQVEVMTGNTSSFAPILIKSRTVAPVVSSMSKPPIKPAVPHLQRSQQHQKHRHDQPTERF